MIKNILHRSELYEALHSGDLDYWQDRNYCNALRNNKEAERFEITEDGEDLVPYYE